MVKKKLTDLEIQLLNLEVEKSKVNREKSILVMEKGMFLYFSFLFIAVIGFVNGYVNQTLLNILILMGLVILIIAVIPYISVMHTEEKRINKMIDELKKK